MLYVFIVIAIRIILIVMITGKLMADGMKEHE